MNNLLRFLLMTLLGFTFYFGHWQFMLGVSMASVIFLLADIRGKL